MKVFNFEYDKFITKDDPMVIYIFSDLHVGNKSCDIDLFKKHVDLCKKENAYWIGLGDYVEAISPKDWRFDVRDSNNPTLEQYAQVEEILATIADKCIAIFSGNHDEKLARDYGDFVGTMCRRLKIPYLGFSGFINILMKHGTSKHPQHNFTIFAHHGHAGGRLLGSKAINLQRLSHKYDANMYLVGHAHTFMMHVDEVLTQKSSKYNRWRMYKKPRYYVSCPAYLDAYGTEEENYVTKASYQPQSIGCMRIELFRTTEGGNDTIGAKIFPILKGA